MLPPLVSTDIFEFSPDIDGLNPWTVEPLSRAVPSTPGVYCFYDADTGAILYVGSTSAQTGVNYRGGLALRMRQYRSARGSTSVQKIQAERKNRRVLGRCWSTASAGDAAKYESDAIEKYKPALNSRLVSSIQSKEEFYSTRKKKQVEYRARQKEDLPAADTVKRCHSCSKVRPLSEFHVTTGNKSGRSYACKDCNCARARKYQQLRRERKKQEVPCPTRPSASSN